ncbi:hypothetical protein [Micromonospora sp. SL4-19]|uniref:hypothetical protein n=1 Tax=Micromonospora sp. SL4-19 TaxID=3399129 RepID=UPI003A4DAFDC
MTELDNLRNALSGIATEVDAVDLRDRALATSHRIRVRRAVSTAVAGLAVATVVLTTAVTVRSDPAPPAVTPAPAPTVLPDERQDGPDPGPFNSATITVPPWGATADATCTTGRGTISHGQFQRDAAHRPANVLSYVVSDVDGDGVDDYVAHLKCGEGPEAGGSQVVAFRRSGAELKSIGRLVGTQDGFAMMDHLEARGGGRVAVLVSEEYTDGGQELVPNQWRTYALQGGRFVQVDGPTSFPAHPPTAVLSVVPTALSFQPAGTEYVGRMTVTVHNTGSIDVARLAVLLILPSQVVPAGAGWGGCARRADTDVTAVVCTVTGPPARSDVVLDLTLVAAEKPMPHDDPVGLGDHYVTIGQIPPFDGQVTYEHMEAIIPISTQ